MRTVHHILPVLALMFVSTICHGQRVAPPTLAGEQLCTCLGAIDPTADDQSFNLAVRHCLNTVLREHSREVLELLHRYPDRDDKAYLLGLLLGGSLDRSCPQYPVIRERLRSMGHVPPPKANRT